MTPFTFTKQLSDSDCQSIDYVLQKHGIQIDGSAFDLLCYNVENVLSDYVCFREEHRPSKATALADVQRLHKALIQALNSSGVCEILQDASFYTRMQKWLESTTFSGDLTKSLLEEQLSHNGMPNNSLFHLSKDTLIESCELALSKMPPDSSSLVPDDEGRFVPAGNVVTAHVAKNGRPQNEAEHSLVFRLANIFESATRKRPTDTEGGTFDHFLGACLKIVDPNHNAVTNRKLIRAALYNSTRYVPKRSRKK